MSLLTQYRVISTVLLMLLGTGIYVLYVVVSAPVVVSPPAGWHLDSENKCGFALYDLVPREELDDRRRVLADAGARFCEFLTDDGLVTCLVLYGDSPKYVCSLKEWEEL